MHCLSDTQIHTHSARESVRGEREREREIHHFTSDRNFLFQRTQCSMSFKMMEYIVVVVSNIYTSHLYWWASECMKVYVRIPAIDANAIQFNPIAHTFRFIYHSWFMIHDSVSPILPICSEDLLNWSWKPNLFPSTEWWTSRFGIDDVHSVKRCVCTVGCIF